MKDTIDRSFKYAMQDTNRIYIGGRMTYEEMISWEEVPFKIKKIVNKDFLPDAASPEWTFAEHFKHISDKSFLYQILNTLKTKVKVDYPVTKIKAGKEQTSFKSRVCTIEEYLNFIHSLDSSMSSGGETEIIIPKGMEDLDRERLSEVVTEEISFSKLAVLFYAS